MILVKRIWSDEDLAAINNLYVNEGKTLKEIGVIFGTKSDTISKKLKEMGVPINWSRVNRTFKHDFFETIDTEEKAYFLGLLTADGSVVLNSERSPNICLELVDKDVLEMLKTVTGTKTPLYKGCREGRNPTYTWSVRSDKMASDLSKHGVVPNKTTQLEHLSTEVPDNLFRHYVRGLVDGDGSIYYSLDKWHVSFTGKNKVFVDSVQDSFKLLTGKQNRKKVTEYAGVHKITYSGIDAVTLCNKLYRGSTYSLGRKYKLARNIVEDIV